MTEGWQAIAALLLLAIAQAGAAEDAEMPAAGSSVWDGIYSEAQAMRGRAAYVAPCGKCHGEKLDGAPDDPDMFPSPPIGGSKFLRNWDGRSLAALYAYTRANMPANNPGFLSEQEFVDLLAYMLWMSGTPHGDSELDSDMTRLGGIVIRTQEKSDVED